MSIQQTILFLSVLLASSYFLSTLIDPRRDVIGELPGLLSRGGLIQKTCECIVK